MTPATVGAVVVGVVAGFGGGGWWGLRQSQVLAGYVSRLQNDNQELVDHIGRLTSTIRDLRSGQEHRHCDDSIRHWKRTANALQGYIHDRGPDWVGDIDLEAELRRLTDGGGP
jgi:hypothetical protein